MRRIGVFVCHCGTNIASTVDVKTVAETLGKEPSVVFATDYPYMCSEAGQNIIKDAIKEYKLEGVVVCSCSPRMHEATFRKAVAAAGLNPYLLEDFSRNYEILFNDDFLPFWYSKEMQAIRDNGLLLL